MALAIEFPQVVWSIEFGGDETVVRQVTMTGGGGAGLSNANPADLGTAAPGVSTEASRADHVHDLPSAADVGAAASSHVHSGSDITSGTVGTARLGSGTADASTFLRGDQTWAAPTGGSDGYSQSFLLGGM